MKHPTMTRKYISCPQEQNDHSMKSDCTDLKSDYIQIITGKCGEKNTAKSNLLSYPLLNTI
jgi:hypothetical protein